MSSFRQCPIVRKSRHWTCLDRMHVGWKERPAQSREGYSRHLCCMKSVNCQVLGQLLRSAMIQPTFRRDLTFPLSPRVIVHVSKLREELGIQDLVTGSICQCGSWGLLQIPTNTHNISRRTWCQDGEHSSAS